MSYVAKRLKGSHHISRSRTRGVPLHLCSHCTTLRIVSMIDRFGGLRTDHTCAHLVCITKNEEKKKTVYKPKEQRTHVLTSTELD